MQLTGDTKLSIFVSLLTEWRWMSGCSQIKYFSLYLDRQCLQCRRNQMVSTQWICAAGVSLFPQQTESFWWTLKDVWDVFSEPKWGFKLNMLEMNYVNLWVCLTSSVQFNFIFTVQNQKLPLGALNCMVKILQSCTERENLINQIAGEKINWALKPDWDLFKENIAKGAIQHTQVSHQHWQKRQNNSSSFIPIVWIRFLSIQLHGAQIL